MKEFKFNEQSAIENMIKIKFVDKNNITNTIYSLAKYNYHVLHLDDEQNYKNILKYIIDNCNHIYEESVYKDIEGCIKSVKKHAFASIDEVCITQSELDVIRGLKDIKQEKTAFVILAVAKYFNALNDKVYDAAFLRNADICKLARITIPVKDRDVFMQFAYDKDVLYRHTWADSTIKKLTFVSHDEDDPVVLRLHESDFRDLAYVYLAYLTPHKYRRCVGCGCWIRKTKKDLRLCEKCNSQDLAEADTFKTIECVDCGALVYVPMFDTATCRCVECKEAHVKRLRSEQNQRYYQKHKIQ